MIEYAGMAKKIEHDTFHETDLVCKSLRVIRLQILILHWMISNSVQMTISWHLRIDLVDDRKKVGEIFLRKGNEIKWRWQVMEMERF
jgi:hypothetical protein